jgi:hypothetical protein
VLRLALLLVGIFRLVSAWHGFLLGRRQTAQPRIAAEVPCALCGYWLWS